MTKPELKGIHHVTAMTDDVKRNYKFMTEILGMRLVKKTVNQDDIQTYHTFYADDEGNAGTDMTFFDFPQTTEGRRGTNEVSRTGLRVPSDEALEYYENRFKEFGVKSEGIQEQYGRKVLPFEESDGQRYQLFSDENDHGVEAGIPWKNGPVPEEFAIYGLGPVEITVSYYEDFKNIMLEVYGFRVAEEGDKYSILEVAEGGNGGSIILINDDKSPASYPGDGHVHHIAFRVEDEEAIRKWEEDYNERRFMHSGVVERHFFKALYMRVGHILIELSTDGPGFMGDEPYETLGEKLSLPPFLEDQREKIESAVRPFDTTRS